MDFFQNQGVKLSNPGVIHILYSGLGGHSAVLFGLLEGGFMRNADHHVLFVGVEQPPADYIRRCEELKFTFHYLPKKAGKGNLGFLLNLRREISRGSPYLLFLHGLSAMPAVALLKLSTLGSKPLVLVRETQANHLKLRRDWIYLALAHRFADHIVHLTAEAAQGAEKKLKRFANPKIVKLIPNGLDTDFYSPIHTCKYNDGIINIGMQSRLQPNKDHKTLITALRSGGSGTAGSVCYAVGGFGLPFRTFAHGQPRHASGSGFVVALSIL
jgi:glycosyltransferase involved in cell wall biosynthesis